MSALSPLIRSVFVVTFVCASVSLASKFDLADEINALKTTWTAKVSTKFYTASKDDVVKLLGTILPGAPSYIAPVMEKKTFLTAPSAIPESFDGRTAWPQCAAVIGHVRDQSSCGSCWAFGATEAFNDRHCIITGDAKTLFSPEDTVSCCNGFRCNFSMGCDGGQPSGAWNWFTHKGVSSGGDFDQMNTGNSCKPYSFESCAHHVSPPPGVVPCDSLPLYETPKCTTTCTDSTYESKYNTDKHLARTSYSVKGVENIQMELMEKGSMTVAFMVYEDFELYNSGVYQHVKGNFLGGHAVKMIGWGVDAGVPYWTCVNSWNNLWGEQGTFRILRGTDQCGIENSCVAGSV